MEEILKKGELRDIARKRLEEKRPSREETDADAHKLIEELSIHQEELLIQNEELRRIQIELEESRTKYFELYDLAPVGYITLTRDLMIEEANLAASDLLGIDRNTLVNRGLSSFVMPRSREMLLLHYRRLDQGHEKQIHQFLFQKNSEREVLIQFESNLVKDSHGIRYRSVLTDVTEHSKLVGFTDALNLINSRITSSFNFEEIMEQVVISASKAMNRAGATVFMKEMGNWVIKYESNLPTRLINLPIGGKLTEMCNLTAMKREVMSVSDAQNDPITSNMSAKGYGLKSAMTAPLIIGGEVIGILGFTYFDKNIEFTQSEVDFARKLAASISLALANARLYEELQGSERKYRELFENLYEGVYLNRILDNAEGEAVDMDIVDINPAGLKGLGEYSIEQLKGKKISDVFSPKVVAQMMEMIREMRCTGKPISGTVQSYDDDRYYLTTYIPAGAAYAIVTRVDVTDQILLEKELKRSNTDLQQLAYVASHDLKEPLRMVSSYLYLLEKNNAGKWDDVSKEYVHFASDGAHRMQAMIDDLLIFARVATNAKPFTEVDMDEVFDTVVVDLKVAIEESGASIVREKLPCIVADRLQMIALLENLIGNAIKYRGSEAPRIHVGIRENQKDRVFSIQDNGIGIDPKYQQRIFQLFQRLHTQEEYKGTGMGLAISKRIIERHGGQIWFESEEGKGAVFFFRIPKDIKSAG
jgi:PAS domain S-box-containing protein